MKIHRTGFELFLDLTNMCKNGLIHGVVKELQALGREFMTGPEDSGLENVWEEICVQVQFEKSIHWSAYHDTMYNYLMSDFEKLPQPAKLAIARIAFWHKAGQSLTSEEWIYDLDMISNELMDGLLKTAAEYKNIRIEDYGKHYGYTSGDSNEI